MLQRTNVRTGTGTSNSSVNKSTGSAKSGGYNRFAAKMRSRFSSIIDNSENTTMRKDEKASQASQEEVHYNKEELERTRQQLLLDKIINCINPKNKEIGIESINSEKILHSKITTSSQAMKKKTLMSLKEEDDKYELVDKVYYESLVKENDELSKTIKTLNEDIAELKSVFKKAGGELNVIKYLSDNQEKLKTENVKKLKLMDGQIEHAKELNKILKNNYTKEKLEKENLYKAIVNLLERSTKDRNIVEEYKRIYNVFNNEYFLASFKPIEEPTVENMLGRIHNLKKQIENKDFELNNLSKLIVAADSKKQKK
jgi:hypothetical protein